MTQPSSLTARQLSQQVMQVTHHLNMYQAELARILHLKCQDIGQLSSGKMCIQPQSDTGKYALLFVKFYTELAQWKKDHPIHMNHWFRKPLKALGNTPHLLLVDEGRLEDVVNWLLIQNQDKKQH